MIMLAMIVQNYRLYIERRDAGRNMARFYALSIEQTLFGQTCLVRRWGRIGTAGRTVQHSFDEEGEAVGLFLELLRAKRRRGYRPRSAGRHSEAVPLELTGRKPSPQFRSGRRVDEDVGGQVVELRPDELVNA